MTWPFENDTSGIVKRISNRSISANRKRNIFIVLTIALASALLSAIVLYGFGVMQETQNRNQKTAQIMYHAISEQQGQELYKQEEIAWVGEFFNAFSEQVNHSTVNFTYANADMLTSQSMPYSGDLPASEDEIVVQESFLDSLGYSNELGQTIQIPFSDGTAHDFKLTGTGYYIEVLFPSNGVRFVSVNEQFDTIDGITNQKNPYSSKIRMPITNAFNEQVSIEIKKKMEATLDMKAQHGIFIGPRAPFGYQKAEDNHDQLIPDPKAAIIVRKIFELAANGIGMTTIVRYLNEKEIPTPIQYARSNGLSGNYDNGNGNWNSRSVKYILTNRTYTGMLVQGKEKRVVSATHEALVDTNTFDAIQKSFQEKAFNIAKHGQSTENILKGKVICGCCGGKMQRKRGTNHADWYFFTCITKNRLGVDKCTGMYVREEDVLRAIYYQLKLHVKEHFISDSQYQQELLHLNNGISQSDSQYQEIFRNAIHHYEMFVDGKISKDEFRAVQDAANEKKAIWNDIITSKTAYEKKYHVFRKLLKASYKEIALSEIIDCIDEITICQNKNITVKWAIAQ